MDGYLDAVDYFTAEIERHQNCIEAMWDFMGKNIEPPFDNQSSFEATYPEYKDIIDKARAGK